MKLVWGTGERERRGWGAVSDAPRDGKGSRRAEARSSGTGDALVMAASAHITAKTVTACVSSALSLYVIVCDMSPVRPSPRRVAARANPRTHQRVFEPEHDRGAAARWCAKTTK